MRVLVVGLVFGEILFYVLIFLNGAGLLALLFMGRMKMPTFYKIRVVVLTPGCNIHKEIKPDSLPYNVDIKTGENETTTYTVELESLWKLRHTFLKRPLYFLMGIKGRYLCLFRSNEGGTPIKNVDTVATPVLIRNVKQSRILGKALAEIFKAGFGGFGRFIIIMIAVGIMLYIAYQNKLIG